MHEYPGLTFTYCTTIYVFERLKRPSFLFERVSLLFTPYLGRLFIQWPVLSMLGIVNYDRKARCKLKRTFTIVIYAPS